MPPLCGFRCQSQKHHLRLREHVYACGRIHAARDVRHPPSPVSQDPRRDPALPVLGARRETLLQDTLSDKEETAPARPSDAER